LNQVGAVDVGAQSLVVVLKIGVHGYGRPENEPREEGLDADKLYIVALVTQLLERRLHVVRINIVNI